MKPGNLILMIMTLCVFHLREYTQLPPHNANYKLIFNDEFDRDFGSEPIDSKKWSRSAPWNQSSNMTENVAWCFPGDTTSRFWDRAYQVKDLKDTTTIQVSNGTCKLITNKTNYEGQVSNWPPCDPANPGYAINGKKCSDSCKVQGNSNSYSCYVREFLPFKYTTGMLFSKKQFYLGYFEIRFRLPAAPEPPFTHQGFGPNFWLFGGNPPVNWWSEIDIFEIMAFNPLQNDSNRFTSTVHYSDKNVVKKPKAHTEVIGNKLKNDTSWHVASAWWTKEFIKFYLDDSLFYTVQGIKEIPVDKLVPMNIIVDVNAPINGRCNNFDPVYTSFPYVYEVDYVRVYQEK